MWNVVILACFVCWRLIPSRRFVVCVFVFLSCLFGFMYNLNTFFKKSLNFPYVFLQVFHLISVISSTSFWYSSPPSICATSNNCCVYWLVAYWRYFMKAWHESTKPSFSDRCPWMILCDQTNKKAYLIFQGQISQIQKNTISSTLLRTDRKS